MKPIKVLAGPNSVDGGVERVVSDGKTAFSEVWGPKGWERAKVSIAEVLKAPLASKELLRKLGVPD